MSISEEQRRHLTHIAEQTLEAFRVIADGAREWLSQNRGVNASALASPNTFTEQRAVANLGAVDRQQREACELLQREPAISRVVVVDETHNEQVFFICSVAPQSPAIGGGKAASYKAAVGRLAALPVGDGMEIGPPQARTYVEVVETSALSPELFGDGWDAIDTTVRRSGLPSVTIDSLCKLIGKDILDLEDSDEIDRILAEAAALDALKIARRRNVIEKMSLRNQPLLDQYQDEIFRLPLDQRLAIMGPAGTGKTTTLIMRVGQKVQAIYLDDREKALLSRGPFVAVDHAQSWLMFTPTELLKQYVKDAFARHQIPASDQRIKTWAIHRVQLARNSFSFLRGGSNRGFVMRDDADTFTDLAVTDPIGWFEDFNHWQNEHFWAQLADAAARLAENPTQDVSALGKRLATVIARAASVRPVALLLALAEISPDVRNLIDQLKISSDRHIRGALTLQHNRDPKFIENLATFIDDLGDLSDPSETGDGAEDGDELDVDDEEEETVAQQTGRAAAVAAHARALRAHALARARGRRTSRGRTARIVEWLGDRALTDQEFVQLGKSLLVQADARRFTAPTRVYLNRMAQRYRLYRRERRGDGRWYTGVSPDIHPLEVDIILLATLRGGRALISEKGMAERIESGPFSALQTIAAEFHTQILIDEATDFSPIQLGCMAALARPQINSVFASGDFNQRLTLWGSRSESDLRFALPDMDIRPVAVAYRQSRQLYELATAIVTRSGGKAPEANLPVDVDNEGYDPVIATDMADTSRLAAWLAARIGEIELQAGGRGLPSIAIFVNGEGLVRPVADALTAALAGRNVRAVPCVEGRIIGDATEVRVFDVQHVKGLEFEAVFLVGIDQLALTQPSLFEKYLYVGTSRAATYLGLTSDGPTIPAPIDALEHLFHRSWA